MATGALSTDQLPSSPTLRFPLSFRPRLEPKGLKKQESFVVEGSATELFRIRMEAAELVHPGLVMVQLTLSTPKPRLFIHVVSLPAFSIVPEPFTMDHAPVPDVSLFAVKRS